MAGDPNGPYSFRTRDSDNDLLRKILNWFNALGAGTASLASQIFVGGSVVSASNPLPVTLDAPISGYNFESAVAQTVTLGGTAQTVFVGNANRVYLFVVNTSDTVMYLEVTGVAATTASIEIAADGGFYEPLIAPAGLISILCATTGKTFVAKQAV
jgi:hypothetical protein